MFDGALTVEEKMRLVEENRHEHGLNACLKALSLSKGTWHHRRHRPSQAEQDAPLKARIVEVIAAHPDYGYRRIREELAATHAEPVNHKRLRRVLRTYELGLRRSLPATKPGAVHGLLTQAGSARDLVKRCSFGPLEAFSTDLTAIPYAHGGQRAWLMTLLCLESRWAGGWAVGPSRNRALALRALDRLGGQVEAWGHRLEGGVLHHDQDSVYTSHAWLHRVLIEERARASYAEHGARDNPWIESFWGRFKTENGEVLLGTETLAEVARIVERQMHYYNRARRHSALGYRCPEAVLSAFINPEKDRSQR